MRNFSEWREEPSKGDELNESNTADLLRQKLSSSSDYLRQAFSGTPHEAKFANQQAQNVKPDYHELEESIANTVARVEEQLAIEKSKIDTPVQETLVTEEPPVTESEVEEVQNSDLYKLYRDREETFECNISIEGASLASAVARIIIDTNTINLIFYGKLYKDGRCLVPLQKMTMYPEGTRGQIRLEVIVDDTVFSPWESACIVEGSKKVTVDVKQKKQVSVNFGGN